MDLMKAATWNNMDLNERLTYLKTHEVDTRSKVVVDKTAKVGEVTPTRLYQGLIGGLCVGEWHESEDQARRDAQTFKDKAYE